MLGVVYSPNLYAENMGIAAHLQYLTGARANDVLSFERWTLLANGNIQLAPQKGNLNRVFTPSEIDSKFYYYISNGINIFDGLFYRKYCYYVERCLYANAFTIGRKSVNTHLFRHLYAKRLQSQGLTDVVIKEKMGERKLQSAQGYIYSSIYFSSV